MKNKGLTYGLILVVGVIWYQVFIRVKSNFEAEGTLPPQPAAVDLSRKVTKPEQFRLLANYRDPFSGNMNAAETAPSNTDPNQPPVQHEVKAPKPKPQPVVIPWPSIRYYGLVRKTTSVNPRTLLAIDGAFYKVRQGEQILDDIFILKVTRDYVQVRYRKEVRTFNKVAQ